MNRLQVDLKTGEETVIPLSAEELAQLPVFSVGTAKAMLLTDLRARRDMAINVLDGLQADALTDGNMEDAAAIKAAKQRCLDLPQLDISAATSIDTARAMYLNEWRNITALVPAGVQARFRKAIA